MSHPHEEQLQPKQRFTGYWIPVELSQLELTKTEQFLLAMIDSLEEPDPNYCFASNAYLAQKMELSESRISHYITRFKRMGLIEEVCFDGRRRRMRTLKSNWYARIEQKSKKELCVVASRQTTRLRVPRLRDSTIPPIYREEDKEQQQRVAKAPVVVSSKKPKKEEQEFSKNDEGARDYMKKLDALGEPYEEKAIIQAFRNNGWSKNKIPPKDELLKNFKNGCLYEGKGGEYECIKDELGIGFLPVDYPSAQPYSSLFKSKTFKKDFEKLLEKLQIKRP